MKRILLSIALLSLAACSQKVAGPDKTVGGAVLGAGWGAGTGAIIGNQINNVGPGVAVGAGMGAIAGAMGGAGFDIAEEQMLDQEHALEALRIQNMTTGRQLEAIQAQLDRAIAKDTAGGMSQVFFDEDATSLKSGSVATLEVVAEAIKKSPAARKISVVGHADDAGTPAYNDQVSEARARSVAAYLASRGISVDQIVVSSFGSKRPLTSNATPEGRQLNRRVDVYILP